MFLQQANTIINIYLSKWINTGDKVIDNTLVSMIAIIISTIIYFICANWRIIYNIAVFYTYRMYNDPFDIISVPYAHYNFKSKPEFDMSLKTITSFDTGTINRILMGRGYTNVITHEQIHNILERLRIKCKSDAAIFRNGMYKLAVSNRGHFVYFQTHTHISFIELNTSGSMSDIYYIQRFLFDHIINEILLGMKDSKNNQIYIPAKNKTEYRSIGKINSKKTFDALFYPQKKELIEILKRFNEGRMYPEHIPMDNKLGILLYGPPGTGKTGTISAIANMLKRSLLVINFAEITTCSELDQILNPNSYEKYVYVFDEFDCVLDVISGSKPMKERDDAEDLGKMLMYAEGDERKAILEMMKTGRSRKADSPIDLAYLLQKLDGLESAENRIIIATTNNPERINPALLRPGRFDIKICLGLCTSNMIVDILSNFYKGGRDKIQKANIPANKYSPLQLINAAIQTPNMDKLLKKLAT